jgi:hypothetical protein
VGRNFFVALITEASGSRTRGKAELRISRPPETTDFVPWRTASDTRWYAKIPATRWAKKPGRLEPPRRMSTRMK